MPSTISPGSSGKKRERSVEWWQDQIRHGLRYMEVFGHMKAWPRWKSYFRHDFKRGILPSNIVYSNIASMIPRVYFRDPRITNTAVKPGFEVAARILEKLNNNMIRDMGIKSQMRSMIQDAGLIGHSPGWLGYDSEYGFSPEEINPATGLGSVVHLDRRGFRIEYNSFVHPGYPWFLRSRPEDTVVPWGTEDARNVPWAALRILRPLEDVKSSSYYKNKSDLKGSFSRARSGPHGEPYGNANFFDELQEDAEWVELWQIRDYKKGEIKVISMDHSKFLREDEDIISRIVGSVPLHWLRFSEDPDTCFGISDAKLIEPQQIEINEIRTQAMKHRRVAILKLLIEQGAIGRREIEKLLDQDVQAVVQVRTQGQDIRSKVHEMRTTYPADLTLAADEARGDAREMIGFSRNQSGEFQGKTHISAQETKEVAGANLIRVDSRRDAVADLLVSIVQNMNQIIFSQWDMERVIQIAGPDGLPLWVRFSGSDLRSDYVYRTDPTESTPMTPETRRREAKELLQAWAEVHAAELQAGLTQIPKELERYLFSTYEGINLDALGLSNTGPGSTAETALSMREAQGVFAESAAQGGGIPSGPSGAAGALGASVDNPVAALMAAAQGGGGGNGGLQR